MKLQTFKYKDPWKTF
jgi:signal-transduction protein with cAMP-binding, CBS, and nucleotidyltransferase domain